MNYLTIGILVIIIALCLYTVISFFGTGYSVPKPIPLNSIYKIGNSSIDIDTSIRYYYEMWLWVDGNFPVDKVNTIFGRGNKFVVGLKGSNLSLYYGETGSYDSSLGTFTPGPSTKTMTIIQNFPFQKWTHFVLNVDSGTVDAYLDGKLVTSIQPNSSSSSAFIPYGDTGSNINIGNVYTQGKVTRFRRPAKNLNPQQVWNTYMMGNGQGTSLTPYHVNVQLLSDNVQQSDTRIF
jgi:hypothetical protein